MRTDAGLLGRADKILTDIGSIELTRELLYAAGMLQPTSLRSLDAIHLASALAVRAELTAMVVYDRLAEAAQTLGIQVAAPA